MTEAQLAFLKEAKGFSRSTRAVLLALVVLPGATSEDLVNLTGQAKESVLRALYVLSEIEWLETVWANGYRARVPELDPETREQCLGFVSKKIDIANDCYPPL